MVIECWLQPPSNWVVTTGIQLLQHLQLKLQPPSNWVVTTGIQLLQHLQLKLQPPSNWVVTTGPSTVGRERRELQPPSNWVVTTGANSARIYSARLQPPSNWVVTTGGAHFGEKNCGLQPPSNWVVTTGWPEIARRNRASATLELGGYYRYWARDVVGGFHMASATLELGGYYRRAMPFRRLSPCFSHPRIGWLLQVTEHSNPARPGLQPPSNWVVTTGWPMMQEIRSPGFSHPRIGWLLQGSHGGLPRDRASATLELGGYYRVRAQPYTRKAGLQPPSNWVVTTGSHTVKHR